MWWPTGVSRSSRSSGIVATPIFRLRFGMTVVSNHVAEVLNRPLNPQAPYVGASAFAHKAGLHASAIRVDPMLYQHEQPESVGNDMRMLVSDMAGRANIQIKGEEMGFDLSDRETAARVTEKVKEAEAAGYTFEAADASFELLLRRELGQLPVLFTVHSWRVFTQLTHDQQTDTECTVRITAKGRSQRVVGEGNGPVNALDHALRNALVTAYPLVDRFSLIDYRVRILDQGHGTDATVRVLIQTTDGRRAWTTVGVGQNIIEASWEALVEAFVYGLIHAGQGTMPMSPAAPVPATV